MTLPIDDAGMAFIHCGMCLDEFKTGFDRVGNPVDVAGESPRSYARLSAAWSKQGFQLWCVRHDANVMHVDFEGQKHPARSDRLLKPGEELPGVPGF